MNKSITANSSELTNLSQALLKSFYFGSIGFISILMFMSLVYYTGTIILNRGNFLIESTDILIYTLGFVLFAWYSLRKQYK